MQSIQNQLNPERCTGLTFNNGHTIPSEMVQPMLDFLRRVLPSA
jgi:phospholipase/carboxylesterase